MAPTEEPTEEPMESNTRHPVRPTLEADPAYDYAEDEEVPEPWDEEDDALDEEERIVPLDEDEKRGLEGTEE